MQRSQDRAESAADPCRDVARLPRSKCPCPGEAMGVQSDMPNGTEPYQLARHALPASLTRALRWLNRRLDQPIQLESLAAAAEVRPRTLEAHFRLYLGTTPLGWVRRMRLARARQQLLSADKQASITSIALANGFSELGRFAARYRHQFGESPSRTLRAARRNLSHRADEVVDEAQRLTWHALGSAFMVGPGACSEALSDAERAEELAPR